ncbi:MAG: glucosaminidase domain-containing protein [Alphaproteobacteria bacterium]
MAAAVTIGMAVGLFGLVAHDHLTKSSSPAAPVVRLSAAPVSPLLVRVSMFKPTTVSNVAGATSKLTALFERIGYRMDLVLARGEVPRLFMSTLPDDLTAFRPAAQRKLVFIKAALPLILHVNELILHDRARLTVLRDRHRRKLAMSVADDAWFLALADKYGLDKPDFDALLQRVDIIPPSLALAQSAEESGWGTSRFAREGNALFGQRTWKDKPGIVPHERAEGEKYRVRAFGHLIDGVKSYAHNLNSHYAYDEFRRLRADLRAEGNTIDGVRLAGMLKGYSERGTDYIRTLHTIMRVNRLPMLDTVRLGDRIEMPPLGPDA